MDLFFKAVTIQARDRAAGIVPDLEDYIAAEGIPLVATLLGFDRNTRTVWIFRRGDGTSYRPEFGRGDQRFGHLAEREISN